MPWHPTETVHPLVDLGSASLWNAQVRDNTQYLYDRLTAGDIGDAALADKSFNTAGVWNVWGAAQVLSVAGVAMKVRATVRGVFYFNAFAGPFPCAARVGISFDGGATWDYGVQANGQEVGPVPANDKRHVTATAMKTGTPTGVVQARAEVRKVSGAAQAISAMTGELDWHVLATP